MSTTATADIPVSSGDGIYLLEKFYMDEKKMDELAKALHRFLKRKSERNDTGSYYLDGTMMVSKFEHDLIESTLPSELALLGLKVEQIGERQISLDFQHLTLEISEMILTKDDFAFCRRYFATEPDEVEVTLQVVPPEEIFQFRGKVVEHVFHDLEDLKGKNIKK